MKKLLTLSALFLLTCAVGNAQVRKTWDFTLGFSDETKANLNADATQWVANRTDATTGEVYGWKSVGKLSGTLTANGVAIKELEGLVFGTAALKGGDYLLDKASIRMSRASMVVNLPNLASGQKVTIMAKSANSTSARGITSNNTNLTKLEGPTDDVAPGNDGVQTWVWQVNDGFTDSVEVSFKILVGGVDISSIVIDEGDAPAVEEDKQVAYIYNSSNYDENNDMAWAVLGGANGMVVTPIDIAAGGAEVTLDSLQNGYDAVVISPYINATDEYVATLKSAIAYEPVLNLNPLLYSAWGYGDMLKSEEAVMTITDTDNALFQDENVSGLIDTETNTLEWAKTGITGVTLGSYFADDDTLAVAGAAVAIHKHNDGRNSYMFLPCAADDAVDGDILTSVLPAAVLNVAKSKKDVTATSSPAISEEYGDKQTTVTITCGNKTATVYYTTDGTDPTEASTPYSEPFVLTSPLTVKAIAYADGYTASKIVSLDVTIKEMAATPTISVSQESGKSVVTINSNSTDSTNVVYYNYTGSTETAESSVYSEPIELTSPVTLTTFAIGDKTIRSEVVSQYIDVTDATLRLDILTKFDANRTDWSNPYDSTGTAKATYLFSWGKSARSMYDTTQPGTTETVLGEDGQPLKNIEGNDSTVTTYPEMAAESLTGNNGEWVLESQGQVVTWENTTPLFNVGDGTNYNPATAEDVVSANDTIGITSYFVNFSGKTSGEPYNARLRTAQAYAGPFDIVVYAGQGNGSNVPQVEIQTSKDGQTWDSLSQVRISDTKRLWQRTKVSYEGSDAVYVRFAHVGGGTKAMIYNAYLLNAGTHTEEYKTGIVNIGKDSLKNATATAIYGLNGVRHNTLQRGVNIVRYSDGTVRKVMAK